MAYTPTTWTTGDTVTATKMNKIENGIANAGGSSWDAVIRLVHSNDSGPDIPTNLTPSIVSGTFADLSAKISNGGYPCFLVEYEHPMLSIKYSSPMGYIIYAGSALLITLAGYSIVSESFLNYGTIEWSSSDTLTWN